MKKLQLISAPLFALAFIYFVNGDNNNHEDTKVEKISPTPNRSVASVTDKREKITPPKAEVSSLPSKGLSAKQISAIIANLPNDLVEQKIEYYGQLIDLAAESTDQNFFATTFELCLQELEVDEWQASKIFDTLPHEQKEMLGHLGVMMTNSQGELQRTSFGAKMMSIMLMSYDPDPYHQREFFEKLETTNKLDPFTKETLMTAAKIHLQHL